MPNAQDRRLGLVRLLPSRLRDRIISSTQAPGIFFPFHLFVHGLRLGQSNATLRESSNCPENRITIPPPMANVAENRLFPQVHQGSQKPVSSILLIDPTYRLHQQGKYCPRRGYETWYVELGLGSSVS